MGMGENHMIPGNYDPQTVLGAASNDAEENPPSTVIPHGGFITTFDYIN
jgi:hypothetical protein